MHILLCSFVSKSYAINGKMPTALFFFQKLKSESGPENCPGPHSNPVPAGGNVVLQFLDHVPPAERGPGGGLVLLHRALLGRPTDGVGSTAT